MKDDGKKYVVYGMKAKCSEGSMENYISTDVGHGVLYQGQPLLNANDHTPQVNLTHFGDCHSKKIYEEAKKQADEKYKEDADDGFFEKAGKLLAKTVTKAAISVKENFCANKCELDTPLPWMFVNKEHMIDGAPALTVESQCACRYGGIITIVPEPEEEVTIETEEVALAENMAEPDEVEVKELEKEENKVRLSAGVGWLLETWPEEVYEEAKNKKLEELEEERKKEEIGELVLKIDWLTLYDGPTVQGEGRSVLPHENAKKYDWGMPEELASPKMSQGILPANVRSAIEAAGKDPKPNITENNLYTDQTGRYWVAVGPNVMNPEHKSDEEITPEEMQYGTTIDIVVLDEDSQNTYYIPAVVGDVKAHSSPDGLYQTGYGFPGLKDEPEHADRSTIEFIGWQISKGSVNITNNYRILEIIVYDGIKNY